MCKKNMQVIFKKTKNYSGLMNEAIRFGINTNMGRSTGAEVSTAASQHDASCKLCSMGLRGVISQFRENRQISDDVTSV